MTVDQSIPVELLNTWEELNARRLELGGFATSLLSADHRATVQRQLEQNRRELQQLTQLIGRRLIVIERAPDEFVLYGEEYIQTPQGEWERVWLRMPSVTDETMTHFAADEVERFIDENPFARKYTEVVRAADRRYRFPAPGRPI